MRRRPPETDEATPPDRRDAAARTARLGEALRANLARRKAQARARRAAGDETPEDGGGQG